MVRWLLFETRAGDRFLRWLERRCGVGVVVVSGRSASRSSGVVRVVPE